MPFVRVLRVASVSTKSGPCARPCLSDPIRGSPTSLSLPQAHLRGEETSLNPLGTYTYLRIHSHTLSRARCQPRLSVNACRSTTRLHLTPCFIGARPRAIVRHTRRAVAPFEPNGQVDAGGPVPAAGMVEALIGAMQHAATLHATSRDDLNDIMEYAERTGLSMQTHATVRRPRGTSKGCFRRRFTTAIRSIVHSAMVPNRAKRAPLTRCNQ